MGKALHPITNWSPYNKSLINRGSPTFWVDADTMNNWLHDDQHGLRGRSQLYTNQPICTFLMLKGIFSLTLRATQGLLDSQLELTNVPLCAPDYSCVSKRARTVKIVYRQPPKGNITELVIDSTGLKMFDEGECKVRKYGTEKRRVWRKLHLAVDPSTHDIVAVEVSLENVHDAEVLPTFLNLLRRKLGRVYADCAYDSKPAKVFEEYRQAALLPKSAIDTPFPQPRVIATLGASSQADQGHSACLWHSHTPSLHLPGCCNFASSAFPSSTV